MRKKNVVLPKSEIVVRPHHQQQQLLRLLMTVQGSMSNFIGTKAHGYGLIKGDGGVYFGNKDRSGSLVFIPDKSSSLLQPVIVSNPLVSARMEIEVTAEKVIILSTSGESVYAAVKHAKKWRLVNYFRVSDDQWKWLLRGERGTLEYVVELYSECVRPTIFINPPTTLIGKVGAGKGGAEQV